MKKDENTIIINGDGSWLGVSDPVTKERAEHTQVLTAAAQHAEEIRQMFTTMLEAAGAAGFVVTIDTLPLQPPAMGNYDLSVNIRPSRALYTLLADLEAAAKASEASEASEVPEDCKTGIHSWSAEPGRLAADAKCSHCGVEYGNPD